MFELLLVSYRACAGMQGFEYMQDEGLKFMSEYYVGCSCSKKLLIQGIR